MTYPQPGGHDQSGSYGYPQDQQAYGQPQGYGQPHYAQQPGQYTDPNQYQQQAAYGYGAPQPVPASTGLPANTPLIVAGIIGALGVVTVISGFLSAYSPKRGSGDGIELFQSHFVAPYALIGLAGLIALTTLVLGATKSLVGVVASSAVLGAVITVFQFASVDPMFEELADRGAGAIVLLITSILTAIAGIVWLLIEGGQIKLAPASVGAAAVATAAAPYGGYPAAPAAPAAPQYPTAPEYPAAQVAPAEQTYAYGYGQTSAAAPAATSEPATHAQASYTPAAASTPEAADDLSATTAFVKPNLDTAAEVAEPTSSTSTPPAQQQ